MTHNWALLRTLNLGKFKCSLALWTIRNKRSVFTKNSKELTHSTNLQWNEYLSPVKLYRKYIGKHSLGFIWFASLSLCSCHLEIGFGWTPIGKMSKSCLINYLQGIRHQFHHPFCRENANLPAHVSWCKMCTLISPRK